MVQALDRKSDTLKAADLIRDAGGRIVGRTKLQKIAYLFETAGVGEGFAFEYRNFGPFSEGLSNAIQVARTLELLNEEEHPASWGGFYSIFTAEGDSQAERSEIRRRIALIANDADSIELELAATAAFLHFQGEAEPWEETRRRKLKKAQDGRLGKAMDLYERIRQIGAPNPLPEIP